MASLQGRLDEFKIDRTDPGRWTITFSNPPINMFLPTTIVELGALTNTDPSNATLSGLSLSFNPQSGATSLFGPSDFNGVPNFTSQDNCASSAGSPFALASQQSCTITISFSPQQSCPWLPSTALGGEPPSACPFPLAATLTVNSPTSADSNTAFAVPISGLGVSALVPSTPELDFGSEALNETSVPQTLSFTNQGYDSRSDSAFAKQPLCESGGWSAYASAATHDWRSWRFAGRHCRDYPQWIDHQLQL